MEKEKKIYKKKKNYLYMRYLGSKKKLFKNIEKLFMEKKLFKNDYTLFDAFAGTSTIGNYFKNKFKIISNDNLYFCYVYSNVLLNPIDKKFKKLDLNPFEYFNKEESKLKGFVYENYSTGKSERQYFSEENAMRIDFIRTKIEEWFNKEKINQNEYFYLIACLLESLSKVSNVAGVYGSYLKIWDSRALKTMKFIEVEEFENNNIFENETHNKEIENLIEDLKGDILYLDPPYSKNQYSTQYHILETIALYDNPKIYGKTGHREVISKNSNFSKNGLVHIEFEKLIKKADFKHIILSYNSDGLMEKEFIEKVLKRYGKENTYTFKKINYRQYINKRTNVKKEHFEYLFYVEKKDKKEILYKSPLNYQGGKYDLIDFIKENLPKNFNRFIDLFGGGFNVGINFYSKQIIYNDLNYKVKELLETLRNEDLFNLYKFLNNNIKKFKLEKRNKETFVKLREFYNSKKENERCSKLLYLLILYGFNQQIRFNSKLEYNNTIGPSGFNNNIFEILISFVNELKNKNITFYSKDFEDIEKYMNKETFVYCDPPYLITTGGYNNGKRGFEDWREKEEIRLLNFLDKLNKKGVKFMLSNILENKKNETNKILLNWIKENNYKLIEYKKQYRKGRKEILIINY